MNELKNRGVDDDGPKGFPEAINAVFGQAIVQTCVPHLIRHSLEFVPWKARKAKPSDLVEMAVGVGGQQEPRCRCRTR